MLWPERNGWRGDLPWVAGLASALKCDPSDFRLAFVRPEHLGTKVVWKDVSKGLQAVALPDSTEAEGVRFPLVPNQTAYFIDTADLEEAYVLSAILNSTMFNALALTVAERAKDAHFRYFGMMVGGVPSPRILRGTAAWHSLARLARRAHTGADVEDELDRIVSGLYGISAAEASRVERFVKCRLRLS
jgi:hypothetical protein